MNIRKLRIIDRNQKGSTMLELLVAAVIAALIAIAVTMGVFQIVTGNARTSNHMTAVRQVQEAGYWISHDTQMAEIVSVNTTPTRFPLVLEWWEWDDTVYYRVEYTLQNDELYRSYMIDGTPASSGIVARFLDETLTSCNYTSGSELVFTVTATVGSGSQQGSETRIYNVLPRP